MNSLSPAPQAGSACAHQYPLRDGWLRAKIAGVAVSDELVRTILSGGRPDDYDFPVLECEGHKARVVFRRRPESGVAK
jgi:hypothetical protein